MRDLGHDFYLSFDIWGDVQATANGGVVVFNEVLGSGAYKPLVQKMTGDGQDRWRWEGPLPQPVVDWKSTAGLVLPDGGLLALGIAGERHAPYRTFSGLIRLAPDSSAAVTKPSTAIPQELTLAVFPNPFNSRTVISYHLPRAMKVTLKVYNVLGREVVTLAEGWMAAGEQRVAWQANGISSGVYFVRLEAGEMRQTGKVLLVR